MTPNYIFRHNTVSPMNTHTHKILGITIDLKLTYYTHIVNIAINAHTSLQILKALDTTACGKQRETPMAT